MIITDFVAGSDFFVAVDESTVDYLILKIIYILDKTLYSWGWNEHYNLGLRHNKNVTEPRLVTSDVVEMSKKCEFKVNFFLILLINRSRQEERFLFCIIKIEYR